MYKVNYDTLSVINLEAADPDRRFGNVNQGSRIAYMDCELSEVETQLIQHLLDHPASGGARYYPIITNIQKIDGHLVVDNKYPR